MKKIRLACLVLCCLLLMQGMAMTVHAEEVKATETTAVTEAEEPTVNLDDT